MKDLRVFVLILSSVSFFTAASFVIRNEFYYVVLFSLFGVLFLGIGLIIGALIKRRGG